MTEKLKEYRYVQVLTTVSTSGQLIQLIGTTSSEDKYSGLDDLLIRHRLQLSNSGYAVDFTSVCFMSSDGKMSSEILPHGNT